MTVLLRKHWSTNNQSKLIMKADFDFSPIKKALGLESFDDGALREALRNSNEYLDGHHARMRSLTLGDVKVSLSQSSPHWGDDGPIGATEGRLSYTCGSETFWTVSFYGFNMESEKDPTTSAVYVRPMMGEGVLGQCVPLVTAYSDMLGQSLYQAEETFSLGMVAESIRVMGEEEKERFLRSVTDAERIETNADLLCSCQGRLAWYKFAAGTDTAFGTTPDNLRIGIYTPYGILETVYAGTDVRKVVGDIQARSGEVVVNVTGWLIADFSCGKWRNGIRRDPLSLLGYLAGICRDHICRAMGRLIETDCVLTLNGERQTNTLEDVYLWIRHHLYAAENPLIRRAPRFAYYYDGEKRRNAAVFLKGTEGDEVVYSVEIETNEREKIAAIHVRDTLPEGSTLVWNINELSKPSEPWSSPYKHYYLKREAMNDVWLEEEAKAFKADDDETDLRSDGRFWLFNKHDPSTEEAMDSLWGKDSEEISALLQESFRIAKPVYEKPDKVTLETDRNMPGLVLPLEKVENKNYLCLPQVSPFLPGQRCTVDIAARHKCRHEFNAELVIGQPGWHKTITAHAAGTCRHEYRSVEPGSQAELELSGVCLRASVMEPEVHTIKKGPLFEMGLEKFLKESPDKAAEDYEGAEVTTDGMLCLMETDYSAYYEIISPVLELNEVDFFGIPLIAAVVPLIRDDGEVRVTRYLRADLLEHPLRVGDNLSALIWLQARLV